MRARVAVALFLAVGGVGCGPVEIRIDETKGVPSVKGTNEVSLGNYTCGMPITQSTVTVQTKVVSGGCEFSYDEMVQILKTSDYEGIPDLKGASNLVQRLELTIKKLAFSDGANMALDVNTRVTSATLSLNGQLVADKAALTSLPKTVSITGDALNQVKTKVDARQAASVKVSVVVVLPDMPKHPDKLKIDYEAQPAVIIGPGKIF